MPTTAQTGKPSNTNLVAWGPTMIMICLLQQCWRSIRHRYLKEQHNAHQPLSSRWISSCSAIAVYLERNHAMERIPFYLRLPTQDCIISEAEPSRVQAHDNVAYPCALACLGSLAFAACKPQSASVFSAPTRYERQVSFGKVGARRRDVPLLHWMTVRHVQPLSTRTCTDRYNRSVELGCALGVGLAA